MRIERFEDILRALRENPQWLAELRTIILTEELLALPARFTAFETRQERMEAVQERTEVRLTRMEAAQERMETRQERTEARLTRVEQRLGVLEGEAVERRYRRNAAGYFGRIARGVRLLSVRERDDLLDRLEQEGVLSAEAVDQLRLADGLFTARVDGQPVWLLLEASATIGREDVTRARDRADLLQRSGRQVLPVVAGRDVPEDIAAEAVAAGVWVVTNGQVLEPAA